MSKHAEILHNKKAKKAQQFWRKWSFLSENVNGLRDNSGRRGTILTWMVALES